jgi:DNA (cytosine-5)-methyltransferase 1
MRLYEEIIFLQSYAKCPWVVENVVPYYEPLIAGKRVGRHMFWSNFPIEAEEIPQPANFVNLCNLAGKKAMMEWLGVYYEENIYYGDNHCPAQILRNCVHPKLGLQIFQRVLMSDPMF